MNDPAPIRPSWWCSLLAIPGLPVGIGLAAGVIIASFVKPDRICGGWLLEMNRANHARIAGGIPQPPQF